VCVGLWRASERATQLVSGGKLTIVDNFVNIFFLMMIEFDDRHFVSFMFEFFDIKFYSSLFRSFSVLTGNSRSICFARIELGTSSSQSLTHMLGISSCIGLTAVTPYKCTRNIGALRRACTAYTPVLLVCTGMCSGVRKAQTCAIRH
jgi:hypothetical protein